MTTYERGDVVAASDPFTEMDRARPFLIANTDAHPFHGEQYIALTLTTQEWYDETIPLSSDHFVDGGVPEESFIVPWGIASPGHDDITDWFGRTDATLVDQAVSHLHGYLQG